MYSQLMRSLNREAAFGLDYGHLLLGLGLIGTMGFTGLGRSVTNTLNTEVVAGLDVGHIALGLGAASTLGIGFYKR